MRSRKKRRHSIKNASLLLDLRCNLNCHHCPQSLLKEQTDFKQFMSIQETMRVAQQLRKVNCNHCTMYGGEPLQRNDLAEIIAGFRRHGMTTSIVTNAFLVDSKKLRALKKAGLKEIKMELFGANTAEHDRYMVKHGSFEKIFQAIRTARELKIKCTISVMPTHKNIANQEFEKMVQLAQKAKIAVDVRLPALVGDFTGEYNHLLTKDEQNYVRRFFQNAHVKSDFTDDGKTFQCPAGWGTINILPDGSVCPCKYIHISFGNILTESLDEIMQRVWSTKIFTGQASHCLAGESVLFNRMYMQPVFNAQSIPLYYKNHLMFIEGEPLVRFYVNSAGRVIEKSENVALEKIKTLRVL